MARRKELVTGACMLGAGLFYHALIGDIPRRGAVDAAFVPTILAWMMIALGAAQLVVAARMPAADGPDAPAFRPGPYVVVGLSLALIAGFVALLRPLGFPVAAALFLFAQFRLLTPSDRRPRHALHAALAVVAAVAIFVVFRYGFRLLLPAGPLTPYLP